MYFLVKVVGYFVHIVFLYDKQKCDKNTACNSNRLERNSRLLICFMLPFLHDKDIKKDIVKSFFN